MPPAERLNLPSTWVVALDRWNVPLVAEMVKSARVRMVCAPLGWMVRVGAPETVRLWTSTLVSIERCPTAVDGDVVGGAGDGAERQSAPAEGAAPVARDAVAAPGRRGGHGRPRHQQREPHDAYAHPPIDPFSKILIFRRARCARRLLLTVGRMTELLEVLKLISSVAAGSARWGQRHAGDANAPVAYRRPGPDVNNDNNRGPHRTM